MQAKDAAAQIRISHGGPNVKPCGGRAVIRGKLKGIANEEHSVSGAQVYRLLEPEPVLPITTARAGRARYLFRR
jgi:hypothetical protein